MESLYVRKQTDFSNSYRLHTHNCWSSTAQGQLETHWTVEEKQRKSLLWVDGVKLAALQKHELFDFAAAPPNQKMSFQPALCWHF